MRANSLAERLTGSDKHGHEAAEVSDYLLLQVLNRFGPLLIHMSKTPLSPEVLYRNLCALAGELSTYVRPQTRRPEEYKEYKHLTPYAGLKSVVDEVQYLLNAVLIRGAQRIPLEEGIYGILNAVVEPTELSDFSSLVLAVKAQMSADTLLQHFSAQTKNRAVRTPAGTDSLAPAGSCFTGIAGAAASDPVPVRLHLLRHPPRRRVVGTYRPLWWYGNAYRRRVSRAGAGAVGSSR